VDESLPLHLAERFRWVVPPHQVSRRPGQYVLYWMHNALRAHENPALDVAILLARQNGLPLLVYHGLSDDYPFASDRSHTFILQGHRDVQRELSDRGISSACHVQRRSDRGPYLRMLTDEAAVLISEEMPVAPLLGWIERLAARTKTAIGLVDTSCIVPIRIPQGPHDRFEDFREGFFPMLKHRAIAEYPEQDVDGLEYTDSTPFQCLSLQDCNLANLVGQCRVDHSISPVLETPGGTRAGYRRWNDFKKETASGLEIESDDIGWDVHDPRLNAYLQFGMISPFRIAREAMAIGAGRYLNNTLAWREFAFRFCFQNTHQIDSFETLPHAAQERMQSQTHDSREHLAHWETLTRARSAIPQWNTCHQSLVASGELRRDDLWKWGQCLLQLTENPHQAMRYALDLYQRYSLDGGDPSSLANLLGCFGRFDLESGNESSISATPTRTESWQSDVVPRVRQSQLSTARSLDRRPLRVAVVGAGLAGLVAARTLADHGMDVTVVDKSRGVGGRLATRRINDHLWADHGAQYFTARDRRLERYVRSWIEEGLAAPWFGRIVELAPGGRVVSEKHDVVRYVGTPSMNAIAKHLAKDLQIQRETRISSLVPFGDRGWQLIDQAGASVGCFDTVIANGPPSQVSQWIGRHADWSEDLHCIKMNPCVAMMLHVEGLETLPFDAAFINQGPIAWIARNDSKPGRPKTPGSLWTIHASVEWSADHIDRDDTYLESHLSEAMETMVGRSLEKVIYRAIHRWRYSVPADSSDREFLWDSTARLGACGDWLCGGRIEGAFLSGQAIAGALLREITIDRPAAPEELTELECTTGKLLRQ
jgi:predicted NAD/FAD-dependent oxidoreductase/deoxyribodipyrimidine photolyase